MPVAHVRTRLGGASVVWFVVLAMLVVHVASAALTTTPLSLDAPTIRNGGATLSVVADNPSFNLFAPLLAQPFSNASAGATVLFFGDSDSDLVNSAIQNGALKVSIRSLSDKAVTLTVSGDYYAYSANRLCVALLRTLFRAPAIVGAPFTACVDIPAEVSVLRGPREVTVGVLGAVSLLLAVVGKDTHTGMLSLGRQSAIGRLLDCDDDLDFILHPTQITVGGSVIFGSLMMNLSIVIALALFHTLVLRQFPKLFSPHLPGDHLVFLLAVFVGTTLATYEVVMRSDAPVRWALATLILLLTYIIVFGCLLFTIDEGDNLRFHHRFKLWMHDTDSTFVPRWRVIFKAYRGGGVRWYFLVELLASAILAVVCALPQTSSTANGCAQSAVGSMGLVAIDTLILLLVWPYHSARVTVFAVALKACEATVAAEAVVATLNPNINDNLVLAGNSMLIVGAVCVTASYAVAVFVAARGGAVTDSTESAYVELLERTQLHEARLLQQMESNSRERSSDQEVESAARESAASPKKRTKSVFILAGPDEGLPPEKGSPYPVKATPPRPVSVLRLPSALQPDVSSTDDVALLSPTTDEVVELVASSASPPVDSFDTSPSTMAPPPLVRRTTESSPSRFTEVIPLTVAPPATVVVKPSHFSGGRLRLPAGPSALDVDNEGGDAIEHLDDLIIRQRAMQEEAQRSTANPDRRVRAATAASAVLLEDDPTFLPLHENVVKESLVDVDLPDSHRPYPTAHGGEVFGRLAAADSAAAADGYVAPTFVAVDEQNLTRRRTLDNVNVTIYSPPRQRCMSLPAPPQSNDAAEVMRLEIDAILEACIAPRPPPTPPPPLEVEAAPAPEASPPAAAPPVAPTNDVVSTDHEVAKILTSDASPPPEEPSPQKPQIDATSTSFGDI